MTAAAATTSGWRRQARRALTAARAHLPRFLFVTRLRRAAGRAVLLTFDDGPHPETTPRVLELLDRHRARAVFFVVGDRIARAPGVLRELVARGHLVGNHTQCHPLDGQLTLAGYVRDVRACQRTVERATGSRPRLHRPPLGTISVSTTLGPRVVGLRNVLWTVCLPDWELESVSAAHELAQSLLARTEAGGILALHDENPFVLPVLEQLLPGLRDRGFDLAPPIESVL